MARFIDKTEECPYYDCKDCKHFVGGHSCKAFDEIPISIALSPESHKEVLQGQKGEYVFEPARPRDTMRIYVEEEGAPED